MAYDPTELMREVWQPTAVANILRKSSLMSSGVFSMRGETDAEGGSTLSWAIEYGQTDNSGTHAKGDVFPVAGDVDSVRAYQNKDQFSSTAKVDKIQKQRMQVNRGGQQINLPDLMTKAIADEAAKLGQTVDAQLIADLEAMIDSAGNFSDAALDRSTYSLASYEATTVGALALADLEDAVEALEGPSYGPNVGSRDELVWLMPRNQFTNLSRLAMGSQYFEFGASQESAGPADAGRTRKLASFEGIDIVVVNGMTTTNILLCHKPSIEIVEHLSLDLQPLPQYEYAEAMGLIWGANTLVLSPRDCAKLSGISE